MDREAWRATVQRVACKKWDTTDQLNTFNVLNKFSKIKIFIKNKNFQLYFIYKNTTNKKVTARPMITRLIFLKTKELLQISSKTTNITGEK